MFVRVKGKEPNRYLQIVENRREGKRTLQRVVATLGRVDELAGGGVDALLISLSRFAGRVQVLEGYRQGDPLMKKSESPLLNANFTLGFGHEQRTPEENARFV